MGSLPRGYRFNPTDREIMEYLKMKKIDRDFSVESIVPEIDALESEPEDIFNKLSKGSNEEEVFFLSKRKRKYPKSDRADRSTRGGHWKPTGKRPKIMTLGIKRRLTFYKGRPHATKSGWIMHEYELDDMKDFVFCRLKKNHDKKSNYQGESYTSSSPSIQDNGTEDTCPEVYSQQEIYLESLVQPSQMHGQVYSGQEANQEAFTQPLHMHDQEYPEQEANQEIFAQPSQMYGQVYRRQEANQEMFAQPLQVHSGIDSSSLSSINQNEDFDGLIASFFDGPPPVSPMESDTTHETIEAPLVFEEGLAFDEVC